jgi:cytochrome P450 family 142 subfamily A polypeptide 1
MTVEVTTRTRPDVDLADGGFYMVGGDETTRHTLTGGTEQLLRHPDLCDRLRREPDRLLPNAVEEMLRWTSPVKNMCRQLTADVEFHGTALKAGEKTAPC